MKKHFPKILIILTFFSSPFLFYKLAYAKPTVAVLWFENRTPDRQLNYLNQLIPDLITSELSKLDFCDVLEREEIEKALDEIILSRQGFVSQRKRVKAGIAETTDYILSGYFEKREENLIVSVRLYNWKKGISQTRDFTYPLSEIKERFGKEIAEYLQKNIKVKEDRDRRQLPISENAPGVTIFLDVKLTFFDFDTCATSETIYSYPYGIIFLEELKDDLQSSGVRCEIITKKEDWEKILQKNQPSAQPTRLYRIFINKHCGYVYLEPPSTIEIWDFGTSDNPINPQPADWATIKRKEFSAPFSSFVSLKNDVSQYILGSIGIESHRKETSSPKIESLIYYNNYLRQKGYGDCSASYQEVLKALYLYPDFSFYWFALERKEATEIYLGLSSWREHPLLYTDTLRNYVQNLAKESMLSSEIAASLIPKIEEIVYESDNPKWRKKDSAILLSRLYLLGEVEEIRLKNLKEKGLISEAEYQNDLSLALLMDRLGWTEEERFKAVRWSCYSPVDWENHSSWWLGGIPISMPDSVLERFRKSIDTQKEFLLAVGEAVKNYPDAIINCYVIKNFSERFDSDLVKKELEKIEKETPNSLAFYLIKFLKLKEEFFLSHKCNEKQLIKPIVEICEILGDEKLIDEFLRESVKKKVDEETLFLLFSELIKKAKTDKKITLINIAPKSIHSRLEFEFGLKRKETKEGTKGSLPSQKIKETSILLDAGLKDLKEAIESCGLSVETFSKETDLNSLSKYKLVILNLTTLYFRDKDNRLIFQSSLLSKIITSLDNGIFILIIPGKSNLIPQTNQFLSQFNCYIDEKKEIWSKAVFLPGIFKDIIDANLDYHSKIGASPGVKWQWEEFYIKGPPIYTEKGNVLIQGEDGYPLAVSIPLPNGTFIISGSCHELLEIHPSINNLELYKDLIFRNIWQILLKELFGYESTLTPVSTIKKLYDFFWKFRLAREILAEQRFIDPLSDWIERKERSFPKDELLASAEILKEVLKEDPDPVIRNYCLFYLGLICRFLKQNEETISYLKKARENAINHGDISTINLFLIDIILRKEDFSKDDYELCRKYCKEGIGIIGIEYEYSPKRIRFYDLQGRLEEKVKKYPEAIASYAEMAAIAPKQYSMIRHSCFAYALFRRAWLLYKSSNPKEAEKAFCELIEVISRDWNLKYEWDESEFYSTAKDGFGPFPVPFEIKVASYLYFREIAEREKKRFLYQKELEKTIKEAEKVGISDKEIVTQLKNILKRKQTYGER